MKKSITPPENWQDFETLCKKLYGEMWKCPDTIKKNGRPGQTQNGVDIYGVKQGEAVYRGIQCKGKDNYGDKTLTYAEIDLEIARAKNFEPPLKALYLATSGRKDVKVEEYVRKRDLESREEGGFEIHLACWEDIVDLIDENRDTRNWYLKERRHKEAFDAEVAILGATDEIPCYSLVKHRTIAMLKKSNAANSIENPITALLGTLSIYQPFRKTRQINLSWCNVQLKISNTGNVVLEDWKLSVDFVAGVKSVDDGYQYSYNLKANEQPPRYLASSGLSLTYKSPTDSALVQKDVIVHPFFLLPEVESRLVKCEWQLIARDFDTSGEFEFALKPDYTEVTTETFVDSEELVGESTQVEYKTETREYDPLLESLR